MTKFNTIPSALLVKAILDKSRDRDRKRVAHLEHLKARGLITWRESVELFRLHRKAAGA